MSTQFDLGFDLGLLVGAGAVGIGIAWFGELGSVLLGHKRRTPIDTGSERPVSTHRRAEPLNPKP